MTDLGSHLIAGAAQPFAWGACDCCSWVCTWVLQRRGVDPMASWRGRYSTRLGAFRRIARGGGMLATVSAEMAGAGLVETSDPQPGDVGLIQMGDDMLLAIKTERGWAAKSERGIVVSVAKVVRAWAV